MHSQTHLLLKDPHFYQLPQVDEIGSFHNGPPDDLFKLPVRKKFGTCTVSVEMQHQGSSREVFEWDSIVAATLRLSRQCLRSWLWHEPGAGALIQFGDHCRILVMVRYYRYVNEG